MEYSGGYLLLSPASTNQAYFLKQVEKEGFHVKKLISMDETAGGVFPNIFEVWRGREPKKPTPVLSKPVLNKLLISRVFGTLEDALEGYLEAKPQDPSASLIGISLDEKYLDVFHEWRDHTNEENGFIDGVVLCLEKEQPVNSGEIFAGYDIAGYDSNATFLSFLGNNLLPEYLAFDPNLSINEFGLFPRQQTAEALAHYTNEVLAEKGMAEENVMWLPWKITIYEGV